MFGPPTAPVLLTFRVLGLLVLGWTGMGGLAALLAMFGADARADVGLMAAVQLFGLLPAIAIAPRATGVVPAAPPRPVPPAALLAALCLGVALQFVLVWVTAAVGDLVPLLAQPPEATSRLVAATELTSYPRAVLVPFSLVFVAPLTEELLFRGAIQPALERAWGRLFAVVATAVLFAAYHVAPFALLYAGVAGLVLGLLRARTGSLLPSFVMHAGFNGVGVLVTAELVPIPGFNSGDDLARIPLPVLLTALCASIAAFLSFVLLTDPGLPLRERADAP